jgi:uridine kinase
MNPMVIGIAGASCTGKSTLARHLARIFSLSDANILDMDGYHIHTRRQRLSLLEYPDDPAANDFDQLFKHLVLLKKGQYVNVPRYDHRTGEFRSPHNLGAHYVLIIEGLHAAMINELSQASLVDISIFIDPQKDLRDAWKVKRDVTIRRYPFRQAVDQIGKREPIVREVILPQRDKADIRIAISSMRDGSPDSYEVWLNSIFLARRIKTTQVSKLLKNYCSFETNNILDKYNHLRISSVKVKPILTNIEKFHTVKSAYAQEWLSRHEGTDHPRTRMFLYISVILWALLICKSRR